MNLVHMLDSIVKQRAAAERNKVAFEKAQEAARFEAFLAELSISATTLIEANYGVLDPSEEFTEKGLELYVSAGCEFYEYVPVIGNQGKPTVAWTKFKDGWRKAGIDIMTKLTESDIIICFVPLQR